MISRPESPAATPLLPERLRILWQTVTDNRATAEAAMAGQERLVDEVRRRWNDALIEPGQSSLEESLLRELGDYVGLADLEELRRRCRQAVAGLKAEWTSTVNPNDPQSIVGYYRRSDETLYELTWWHTLVDDLSPLAYVNALDLAEAGAGRSRSYLDFGSGVGSGGLLFAHAGFEVTLADISLPLLGYCRWRFARRGRPARFLDAAVEAIPDASFDIITAMDVFEHLVDPVGTAEMLVRALRPGGILVARLHAEEEPDRPQHIVTAFDPVFERLDELHCVKIWEDDWLWGHQAFQKR